MAQSKQDELYKALQQKGYPDSLCREIAYKQMNTDYTATRMLGYLYRISDPRPVADLICGTDSRAFLLLYNLCSSVYKQFPCKGCPDSLSVAVLCIIHPVLIVP